MSSMPVITLPDGSQRTFDKPVTISEVAADIGPGLAKATLAGRVDGKLIDAFIPIEADAQISIVTDKDPEGLEVIRHSCAHLLAQAVKQLFPTAQVTIGPVIENGFYYDFAFGRSFTPEDLERIEKKMHELAKQDFPVTREVISRNDAITFFRNQGEEYKAQIIEDIPEDETLTLYKQGEFVDLCRGPHVPSTGKLKAFKLMKLAGAYWRGDAKNEMLQRIYGTAWPDKKQLKAYLHRLEEAEKRDHRRIGKQMDLFHTQEEGPGMVFWHPNGWRIYRRLMNYIREVYVSGGYEEIHTPMILDKVLWEKSGHWDKFYDDMFVTASENREYAIKPMNCPCHVQVYNQGLKSYRDLPVRFAEFGCCHRNEASGTLHGLMRVRNLTQDDGHIFCTDEQLQDEVAAFIDQLFKAYHHFGFETIIIKVSTRPEKRVGSDEEWDKAEQALMQALDAKGLPWEEFPGEGAFYGPKIEFSMKDCLDRVWQCGTIQVDYSMPKRLEATYVDEHGEKRTPVMLHRAILGSLERFTGILIEHYAGKFPLWLAPVQVTVMTIAERHTPYAEKVANQLKNIGLYVDLDVRNEKVGFKIREHTLARVPYFAIIGDQEEQNGTVSVRTQSGEEVGAMTLDAFIERLTQELVVNSD